MAFADLHSCPDLLNESQRFARKHFPEVRMSEEFIQLPASNVIELISSNELGVLSEEDVFEAIMQWVNHDRDTRMQDLPSLVQQVRYQLLPHNYIVKHVVENELLKSSQACKDFIIDVLKYRLMSPLERASIEEGRGNVSRVRIGGPQSILIVGGQAPKAIRNIEIYDIKTHVCKVGPDLLSRRCRCGVTVLKGSVYAVGGFDGTSRVR
jgi:kelch-like protein 2/3